MNSLSEFYGPNAGYVLDLYERYQQDPASVDDATRALFAQWTPTFEEPEISPSATSAPSPLDVSKIVGAARVTRLIRELGHLTAHIDPLGSTPPGDPGLELATHGLETADLAALPASVVGGPLAENAKNALEAVGNLRRAYSGSIGYEDDHIQVDEERKWIVEAIESRRFFQGFNAPQKLEVLERLTEVETFERFLHQSFIGQKWFSIEGTDMLVPILDQIIHDASHAGTREVVMGMAHRGRLNVLAHILGKPYAEVISEFQTSKKEEPETDSVSGSGTLGYSGDVKYHLGARRSYTENGVRDMPITLTPNPSHLEFVDPVVVGRARAAQEKRDQRGAPRRDSHDSLAILIHGDAAFPGQGIVPETLNLSQLVGYTVGGTIHIITNNQIGFTTSPKDSRSTLYASDLAKGFEIPIVHVNADDPEACIAAARMGYAYRERFGKDFLIDLVGYRRHGHNEGDEPSYTQPRMYEIISKHPTVRALWAKELERQGIVNRDEADAMTKVVQEKLEKAKGAQVGYTLPKETFGQDASPQKASPETAISADRLRTLNEALLKRPEDFTINAKLDRILSRRRSGLEEPKGIDWAHAESLAFASILEDGTPIRLAGQDSERGTFGVRHSVLHDPMTGDRFVPLQALPEAKASFAVYNSPLSENAVLGFEYGYSTHAAGALVLWEAQYGDFANGAQVIIDQFLVSGNTKWQQTPSLVLLLPHGYEGGGSEHSSARLERFLELAAGDNIRVANCTTSAQYFHLLRRQTAQLSTAPRPLIVMTPKSLLRHPKAGASLTDLTQGTFQPVLDDPDAQERREKVKRVVLCSGKVYVDLITSPRYTEKQPEQIAIVRVEELYPFPKERLQETLARYPQLTEVIWLQEEPRNMGAWTFVEPRLRDLLGSQIALQYIGRPASASPAEGSAKRHAAEQARLITTTLSLLSDPAPQNGVSQEAKTKRSAVTNAR